MASNGRVCEFCGRRSTTPCETQGNANKCFRYLNMFTNSLNLLYKKLRKI